MQYQIELSIGLLKINGSYGQVAGQSFVPALGNGLKVKKVFKRTIFSLTQVKKNFTELEEQVLICGKVHL